MQQNCGIIIATPSGIISPAHKSPSEKKEMGQYRIERIPAEARDNTGHPPHNCHDCHNWHYVLKARILNLI